MSGSGEVAIRVNFHRGDDGKCYISSPDVIGLHLAGHDIDALRRDLEPVIKDLIWYNLDRVIDRFHWIPSLEMIADKFKAASVGVEPDRTELCVVSLKAA